MRMNNDRLVSGIDHMMIDCHYLAADMFNFIKEMDSQKSDNTKAIILDWALKVQSMASGLHHYQHEKIKVEKLLFSQFLKPSVPNRIRSKSNQSSSSFDVNQVTEKERSSHTNGTLLKALNA